MTPRTVFEETKRLNRCYGDGAKEAAWRLALGTVGSEELFTFYMACFEYYCFLPLEGHPPRVASPGEVTNSRLRDVARMVLD
jgi:hypothetical protein